MDPSVSVPVYEDDLKIAELYGPRAFAVYVFLRLEPEATIPRIATCCGMSKTTVVKNLQMLREAEVIQPVRTRVLLTKTVLRKMVMERDAYRCQQCGGWIDLEVDHIVPRSRGGTDDLDNLQTLCRTCNRRKGNRL